MRQLLSRPWLAPTAMGLLGLIFLYWGVSGQGLLNYAAALILLFLAVRFLATTRVESRPVG